MKLLCIASLLLPAGSAFATEPPNRPNILWITAEDMSPTLGCYGDPDAITPNIDALAKQSVRYLNAFATAPVCSPSRSCLITGRHPTSLSTQQMRSGFPIPARMKGFPALLRAAGYYTTNNVKTDYNTANYQAIIKHSWNENAATAHWRSRPDASTPFFAIFNLMTSHQSRTMVWPYERFQKEVQNKIPPEHVHDPAKVTLPPYYPDTPVIRKTVARFHDCVTAMDQEVGALLKQLDEDELATDTIVFFYSDHGSGMPRHKRALLDSGMKIPLLVRFPKKYAHLAPDKPGSTTDRLVNFLDFGPTVLHLAGCPIPADVQGRPFLGPETAPPPKYLHGHRDRVDEVRDLARSVRDKRFLYIRNYMPHLGYNQPTAWPDLGEIRHEFYRLASSTSMTKDQWNFVSPTRPAEELYDCRSDPQNLRNLAASTAPEHKKALVRLRKEHRRHLRLTADLGFLPESEAWALFAQGKATGWELGQSGKIDLAPIHAAAAQVGLGDEKTFLSHLASANPNIRYWGALGLAAHKKNLSTDALAALRTALNDESAATRIEAAGALAKRGHLKTALPYLLAALAHENLIVATHAARTIELLGKDATQAAPAMKAALQRAERIRPPDLSPVIVLPGDKDLAMFVAFSCRAFLAKLEE